MSAVFQPKLIYLAHRHPAYSRAAWTARWRQHGTLGMSLPRWKNVARYVHCDIIAPQPGEAFGDQDGVGLIWHHSLAHRDAHFADTSSQARMEADEVETFAAPIASCCLSAREEFILAPPADAQAKLICFLHDDNLPARPALACGHVANIPISTDPAGGRGLDCQRVEEYWFASLADARRAARQLDLAGRSFAVLATETQLYRAADNGGAGIIA